MQERRTANRVRINLNARWEGLVSQGRGAICDLSPAGCFVLTGGEVTGGELVRLEIVFPREIAHVWGHVVYAVGEMGFALRFVFSNEDDRRALDELVASLN
jgi:hypothetical protein